MALEFSHQLTDITLHCLNFLIEIVLSLFQLCKIF